MDSPSPPENQDVASSTSETKTPSVLAATRPLRDVNCKQGSRRSWWITLSILALTVILGVLVYPHDLAVSQWIIDLCNLPGDFRRVLALSELIAHGSGVLVLLGVTWMLAPHLRIHLPRVGCCAFMAGLVANGVKLIHARIRPLACPPDVVTVDGTWQGWLPSGIETFSQPYGYAYQSFPSAHTATAVGFSIGLAWLFPRGRYLFFTIAAMAGLQRVAFMAHWPSDVVCGAVIGIVFGSCFTLRGTLGNHLFDRFERYRSFTGKTPIGPTSSVIFVAGEDAEGEDSDEEQWPDRRAA